jgi:glycosyltransferase involved in cell wall biosynthesis
MVNILYLYPREYFDRKMSVGRVLYGEAVARQSGIELKFWGPGWPGYDDKLNLKLNLAVNLPGFNPQVCWFYKADKIKRAWDVDCIRVLCFNEANDKKKVEAERRSCYPDVIVYHHESDLNRWDVETPGPKRVHILHGAEEQMCQSQHRHVDCLFAGVSAPAVYPLRERLKRFVAEGRLPGEARKHPGYRLSSHKECREQYENYFYELSRAKILLTCGSKWRYPLAKIIEGMMAGCAVVTDKPDDSEFEANLWPHCIQIDNAWDDARIVGTIRDWLDRPDDLAVLAEGGRQAVLAGYTTDHYAKRLLAAIG